MTTDTTATKWIRGLVKTVFIVCYVAFMWASIHHIATFFNDFEADGNNIVGSYLLAGAFDITALVTTIGVMFFRKSMPRGIQIIVWAFIIAIAGYSFFVNWEYAAHYQNVDLVLQQTGATTPVYDVSGTLHYVPVMQSNTNLIWINPILASGFTVFSLVYSVVAEFFGTKPPNVEDLVARKKYLEETSGILEEIKILEEKNKKPSFIQRAKGVVIEVKSAANEVIMQPHIEQDIVANENDMQDDITPIMEEEQPAYAPRKRDELGMIEGVMYDKVTEDKSILITLLYEAQMNPISDLTASLQRQFSGYANYITETRVQRVFDAICADYPELISTSNGDDMEPDTDPELETISPANDVHISGEIVADLPANITDISNAKKRENDVANQDTSRGSYAITKEAASERLRCSLSEIERGIKLGIIKPFAKSSDKVLISSLRGFTPHKRGRKVAAK